MRMDMLRGPDAATLVVRAVRAQAAGTGIQIAVRSIASRPWASATFLGLRHRVVVESPPGAALAAWIATLPEAEWSIRGHLVADLVIEPGPVDDMQATFTMLMLTIAEDRTA